MCSSIIGFFLPLISDQFTMHSEFIHLWVFPRLRRNYCRTDLETRAFTRLLFFLLIHVFFCFVFSLLETELNQFALGIYFKLILGGQPRFRSMWERYCRFVCVCVCVRVLKLASSIQIWYLLLFGISNCYHVLINPNLPLAITLALTWSNNG